MTNTNESVTVNLCEINEKMNITDDKNNINDCDIEINKIENSLKKTSIKRNKKLIKINEIDELKNDQELIKKYYLKNVAKHLNYDVGRSKTTRYENDEDRLNAKKESFRKYINKRKNMKNIDKIFDLFGGLSMSGKVETFVRLLQFFSSDELNRMQYIL